MSGRFTRRILAVVLVAANLAMAGIMRQEAAAFYSPCSDPGHCHCFDDGSGDEYCSHVMGGEKECKLPWDCNE